MTVPVHVEDYKLNYWTDVKDDAPDAFLVDCNGVWTKGHPIKFGVMLGVRDGVDASVTTLTVEQARGLATLLLYQAKLSEERNNA